MPPRHGTLTLLTPSPRHPPNLSAHAYQAFHELEAAVATLHRGSAACAAAQQPERAAELRMMAMVAAGSNPHPSSKHNPDPTASPNPTPTSIPAPALFLTPQAEP